MRLRFVTIGQNLKWSRKSEALREKKTLKGNYISHFSKKLIYAHFIYLLVIN